MRLSTSDSSSATAPLCQASHCLDPEPLPACVGSGLGRGITGLQVVDEAGDAPLAPVLLAFVLLRINTVELGS